MEIIITIIVAIIVLLAIIFLANSVIALIEAYNSDNRHYYMNKYLVIIGGVSVCICILGLIVLTISNLDLEKQLKKPDIKYKIVNEHLYRIVN